MGLYVGFDPIDVGLPQILQHTVEVGFESEDVEIEVDYSYACDIFVDTFLAIATRLVPVDTGYLRSTLDAWTDGFWCEATTECEYAEYVEYGTEYQKPQPYFEPAFEEAFQAFIQEACNAIDEATGELEAECLAVAQILQAAQEEANDPDMGIMDLDPTVLALIVMLAPLFILAYGLYNEMKEALGADEVAFRFALSDFSIPQIEII